MADRHTRRFALAFVAVAVVTSAVPATSMAAGKVHHHAHHAVAPSITNPTNTDDDGCTAADGGHAICFQ